MKKCTKCNLEKPYSDYYKKKNSKDGYSTICKKCSETRHTNVCKQCGQNFRSGKSTSKFCSIYCKGEYQKSLIGEENPSFKRIEKKCANCEKTLLVTKFYSKNRNNYCDVKCKEEYYKKQRITFNCEICGKEKSQPKWRYERSQHHYCSSRCMDKGKEVFHSQENSSLWNSELTFQEREERRKNIEYRKFIQEALEYNNYTCDITGVRGGDLEVHHLNGYSWFKEGRMNLNNVVVLNKEIHKKYHYEYGFKNTKKEDYIEFKQRYGNTEPS